MISVKYLILGAGPSGLSFALTLLDRGENSFLILEKEDTAGGLCRSTNVDGHPLDIGGGHFLDLRNKHVLDFIFRFLPEEEWLEHERRSAIKLNDYELNYPFESNLWQLPIELQLEYLESIATSGCFQGAPEPDFFEDWIVWKLGDKIADDYLLPYNRYNRKIWAVDLNRLGTYWLYKLPDINFRDALRACLEKRVHGKIPAHPKFLYPKKYGYGEVWKRMGEVLGGRLRVSTPVLSLDSDSLVVNGEFQATKIVSTIPWTYYKHFGGVPTRIKEAIDRLEYTSIKTTYSSKTPENDAHWIYLPDENVPFHRILCRSQFCFGSRGCCTETNLKRAERDGEWSHINEYAYPLNTIEKPKAITMILEWAKSKSIYGLGRWGEWEHMNSDVSVDRGMRLARILTDC